MLLIVDDDPRFLEAAERMLNPGRGVFFAGNARHAKQLIRIIGDALSVVLIDLDLPGEDGFSLIRELRDAFPDLPLIAISGVVPRDVLESAKALGAAEALPKPINSAWNAAIDRARSQRGGGA
jgi:CheY-like chemotaxis protein